MLYHKNTNFLFLSVQSVFSTNRTKLIRSTVIASNNYAQTAIQEQNSFKRLLEKSFQATEDEEIFPANCTPQEIAIVNDLTQHSSRFFTSSI